MAMKTKMPGGVLQHTDRAGLEIEGLPEFRPDCLSTNRQMQVNRLMRRHRMPLQRAFLVAGLAFGEVRE